MRLDGWRCKAEAIDERVRLWSRGGHDWTDRLPELLPPRFLGDLVLDGELAVATLDGRADFELLGGLILVGYGQFVGVATLALSGARRALLELIGATDEVTRRELSGSPSRQ
jgi:hypothetical protein